MTTDMIQPGQEPAWEVYDVQDTFGPTSLSGSNRIKRVLFHVKGSADSYVDIPFAQFNAQNVAAAIDDHVLHTVDVMSLKGPVY